MQDKWDVESLLANQQCYLDREAEMRRAGAQEAEVVNDPEYCSLLANEEHILKLWELEESHGRESNIEDSFPNPFAGREWYRRRKWGCRPQPGRSQRAKVLAAKRSGKKQRRMLKGGDGKFAHFLIADDC